MVCICVCFCCRSQRSVQSAELACVSAIVDVVGANYAAVGFELFTVVICVVALHRTDDIDMQVDLLHSLIV